MKTFLIIISIVILGAIVTNPKKADHVEAIKDKLVATFNDEANFEGSNIVGLSILSGSSELFLAPMTEVENYFLFSLTIFKIDGIAKVIGIGAFNQVYISDFNEKQGFENITDQFNNQPSDRRTMIGIVAGILGISLIAFIINEFSK